MSVAKSREFNHEALRAGRVSVQQASVDALPFEDATIDAAVSVESLYFWPSAEDALKEILRVLKPGGRVLIVMEIHESADLPESVRENIRAYNLFVPTLPEMEQLLCDAGAEEVVVHTRPGLTWFAAEGVKGL